MTLRKASGVFISRKGTIYDFRRKIGEILFANNTQQQSLEELMSIARLWRLETGENVFDIEKEYDYALRDKD